MLGYIIPLCAIIVASYLFKKWLTKDLDYFDKKGLKSDKEFKFRNLVKIFKIDLIKTFLDLYNKFPDEKIFGAFQFFQPVFFLRTPEIIKQIVVKDFNHFQNRRTVLNVNMDKFLSSMLASMKGKEWREMRNALSPAFTGSKMRHMFPFITKCAKQIVDYFDEEYTANGPTPHNMKQCFAKYSNDVIASCAFGLECDSFKDPENIIYKIGKKFLEFQKPLNLIKSVIMILFPRFSALIGLKFFDNKSKKLFFDVILNNMDEREKLGIHRPDLISILMELKKGQNVVSDNLEHNEETQPKRTWTDEELVAQCFSFFLAGFETVSSTLVFAAHELAVNTDVQTKLVQEIEEMNERLNGKDISYEQLQSLKYLDMVVNETLRKWPLAVVVDRECVKDYNYEDEDGLKFTIEKGKGIWVPVYPIHMNPNYFPEPEKFYPERYSEDNKSWADMNAFLSFGTGPRNCIGSRFALMELKAVIYYIIQKFQFKVCEETDVPIKLKKTMLGLFPEKDVKLFVQPR